MSTPSTVDAVAVVSASRFGFPGFVAEAVAEADTPGTAADLVAALGEVAAAVEGVLIALTGSVDGLESPTAVTGDATTEFAHLVVRCASEGDRGGVGIVCAEAATRAGLASLICTLVAGINRNLDRLDAMPGPGSAGLLERLGLAAALRDG